jgi:hypothetical protein
MKFRKPFSVALTVVLSFIFPAFMAIADDQPGSITIIATGEFTPQIVVTGSPSIEWTFPGGTPSNSSSATPGAITFPDNTERSVILTVNPINAVTTLRIDTPESEAAEQAYKIKTVTGLELMTGLSVLYLYDTGLTSLPNVNQLTALQTLRCSLNFLGGSSVRWNGLSSLTSAHCYGNDFTAEEVDQLFIDLNDNGLSNGEFNLAFNAGPSAASDTARTELVARGNTLAYNTLISDPGYVPAVSTVGLNIQVRGSSRFTVTAAGATDIKVDIQDVGEQHINSDTEVYYYLGNSSQIRNITIEVTPATALTALTFLNTGRIGWYLADAAVPNGNIYSISGLDRFTNLQQLNLTGANYLTSVSVTNGVGANLTDVRLLASENNTSPLSGSDSDAVIAALVSAGAYNGTLYIPNQTSASSSNVSILRERGWNVGFNQHTLSVVKDGNGTGGVAGSSGINCGSTCSFAFENLTEVTLEAYPSDDSTFSGWSGGGCSGSSACTVTMDAAKTVTATFTLKTYTVTPSAGANGSLSPSTAQTVNSGSTTSFTVSPDTGYHIDSVSGCSGSLADSTYTTGAITADCTVTAGFAINSYTLTYTAGSNGSISGTSPQTVNYGASGSAVTAVPAAHYHFVNWSDDSSVNPRTDTNVSANINVTANFAIDTYTLTYTAGSNGSISGTSPQTVNYGASGSAVTAVPAAHYHFVNWSDSSTSNPRTDVSVSSNISVTANFSIDTYTLTYTAGSNGSISGTSPQIVNYGASGSAVTAVPATGYYFVKWSDDSTNNPRTDSNVTTSMAVSAVFAASTYTVTASTDGHGTVSCSSPVAYDGSSTCTITPSSGYQLATLKDNSSSVTIFYNTTTYTISAVKANHSIVATFGNSCAGNPVKNENKAAYYTSVQTAYDNAASDDSLLAQAYEFTEDLLLDRSINITFTGGYSCDYQSSSGFSAITGTVTIRYGSFTADKLIIR